MRSLVLPAVLILLVLGGTLMGRTRSKTFRNVFDACLLAVLSGVMFHAGTSPLLAGDVVPMGPDGHWLRAVGIVWWFSAARLATAAIARVLGHDERSREAKITSDLAGAAIHVAALLVVLNFVLLLPVNGLLATSGVIAVVIGLALQNTLADVFSGIAVGVEHPFSVGDRVTLGDGVEGMIVQVNWRSIRIQTDGEDVATIPNSVVAKSQILNRSFPTERRSTRVVVTSPASTSPDRVLPLLKHASLLCPGILRTPRPIITLARLGVLTNAYAIDFFVGTTREMGVTKSLLLQQVHRQFLHAGLTPAGASGAAPNDAEAGPACLRLVRGMGLFDTLSAEDQKELAGKMTRRLLAEGDVLFEEGACDNTLHVIDHGIVEIARKADGVGDATIGRIGVGEYIGEIGLLTGAPHAATATAITSSIVYSLPREALLPLLSGNPELAVAMDESLRRGIALLERRAASLVGSYPNAPGALLHGIRTFFSSTKVSSATRPTAVPPERGDP